MKQLSEKYDDLDAQPVRTATIQLITNKQLLPQFSQLNFDALTTVGHDGYISKCAKQVTPAHPITHIQ